MSADKVDKLQQNLDALEGCSLAQDYIKNVNELTEVQKQLSGLPENAAASTIEPLKQKVLDLQQGGSPNAEIPLTDGGNYWMPTGASDVAQDVDMMYYATLGLSLFCFVAIAAAVIYLVVKYRARPGHKPIPSPSHNNLLEVTWTIIPSIICVFLFIGGWNGYLRLQVGSDYAEQVNVTAKKWGWKFDYSNGASPAHLHFAVDRPVRLSMTAEDILHSFFVPAFRVKQDLVPRRYGQVTFTPIKEGKYRLFCTEYCGTDHSMMKRLAYVHTQSCFDKLMPILADVPLDQIGRGVYNSQCASCHSLDGKAGTGPSFKGVWGSMRKMTDGSEVLADENYIRESILQPGAKVRAGFGNKMAPQSLNEKQILGVIEFLKSPELRGDK